MSRKAYIPPHRRHQCQDLPKGKGDRTTPKEETTILGDADDKDLSFCRAFARVCCINLKRREDRWKMFQDRMLSTLGNTTGRAFLAKVERFEAVDGAAFLRSLSVPAQQDEKDDERTHLVIHDVDDDKPVILMEWDATNNALYDRHIQEPLKKPMTPGEVGCAMSHVKLWKELSFSKQIHEIDGGGDPTMLILEDDAVLYKRKPQEQEPARHGQQRSYGGSTSTGWRHGHNKCHKRAAFLQAFDVAWTMLPHDWDIIYLGISDRGERKYVECHSNDSFARDDQNEIDISIFRPTYGFHTHAYALRSTAASVLLSNLPVIGPLDVWLADNNWFDLNVYCAIVTNEGWRGQGAPLVGQRKHDTRSDIRQSGRVEK